MSKSSVNHYKSIMIIKFTLLLLFTIQISNQEPSPHEVSNPHPDHANLDYMADPHPHHSANPPPPPIEVHVHLDTNGKSKEIEKGSLTITETKSKRTKKEAKGIEKGSLTMMKKDGKGFVEVTGSRSGIRLRG